MNKTLRVFQAGLVAGILLSGQVMAQTQEPAANTHDADKAAPQPDKVDTKAKPADKPAKASVTPHNHMRDAKGIWVPEKKPKRDQQEKPNSTK